MSLDDTGSKARVLHWVKSNWKALSVVAVCLVILGPVAISLGLPGDALMEPPSTDSFELALQTSARRSMGSFMWWYKTNVVLQVTLVVASLAAAVTAALTTKENAQTIKIWSVLFTAITAAVATAQQTFHVKENINAFIGSTWNLELLAYDYASRKAQLKESPTDDGVSDKNKAISADLLKIQKDIMQRYAEIEADRMRAFGNIGEQTARDLPTNSPSPPARNGSAPESKN